MPSFTPSRFPAPLHVLSLGLLVVLSSGCAHRGAPTVYPVFDPAGAQASLVVATVQATGDLAPFPECALPDVLCMDPAPTWMKLRALETVHGKPLPEVFFASTTSHYGRIDYAGPVRKPMLMLMLTQDDQTVMARYARALLEQDSAGGLHVVLTHPEPSWLPCGVAALREPITDPRLARASAISLEHYRQFHAETRAGYFRVEGAQAYPRYSLPIARLRAHLAGQSLSPADFACDPPPS